MSELYPICVAESERKALDLEGSLFANLPFSQLFECDCCGRVAFSVLLALAEIGDGRCWENEVYVDRIVQIHGGQFGEDDYDFHEEWWHSQPVVPGTPSVTPMGLVESPVEICSLVVNGFLDCVNVTSDHGTPDVEVRVTQEFLLKMRETIKFGRLRK